MLRWQKGRAAASRIFFHPNSKNYHDAERRGTIKVIGIGIDVT